MLFKRACRIWLACALAVTVVTAVSIRWLDIPIARLNVHNISRLAPIGDSLGSSVLISGELFAMAVLISIRLALGHLFPLGKAMLVSIVASLTAFAANDAVLKVFFGLPNPGAFLFSDADHTFHFFSTVASKAIFLPDIWRRLQVLQLLLRTCIGDFCYRLWLQFLSRLQR